jgi:hypothetical protein
MAGPLSARYFVHCRLSIWLQAPPATNTCQCVLPLLPFKPAAPVHATQKPCKAGTGNVQENKRRRYGKACHLAYP